MYVRAEPNCSIVVNDQLFALDAAECKLSRFSNNGPTKKIKLKTELNVLREVYEHKCRAEYWQHIATRR